MTLPRDPAGQEWGTAEQIARRLTSPDRTITAATIRKWAWRSRRPGDKLHRLLPGRHVVGARTGETWYRLADAARVEAATARDQVRLGNTEAAGGLCPLPPVEHLHAPGIRRG